MCSKRLQKREIHVKNDTKMRQKIDKSSYQQKLKFFTEIPFILHISEQNFSTRDHFYYLLGCKGCNESYTNA
jgi:hypothetical protein